MHLGRSLRWNASPRSWLVVPLILMGAGLLLAAPGWTQTPDTNDSDCCGDDAQPLSGTQEEMIQQLEAIGYAAGTQPAPATSGVTIFKQGEAWEGLNLYCSGHDSEAELMDMNGSVLHTWQYDYHKVWPGRTALAYDHGDRSWRHVHLLPNGDLLAIYEGEGLVKLDKDSNLIWAYPGRAHHDLEVLDNGDIYVLTREAHVVPRYNPDKPILEDFVTVLDADGQVKKQVSLLGAFERSDYGCFIKALCPPDGDIMHANTLNRLDGSLAHISPLYKAGNILTSFKTIDCLAILDMDEERLVWLSPGPFEGQHQPELLQDGNLILFNNNRFSDYSEVLVWNPLKRQTVWYYLGDPPTSFFSKCCGIAQKLPNGDILATSTGQGRVIEITPDKRIVWEYINPHRIGTNGETIASLWEMERLPKDFPVDWAVTPKKPVPSE